MVEKKFWVAGEKVPPGAPVFLQEWFNTLETGYTNIKSMRLTLITK
jgi:hypothetical protein